MEACFRAGFLFWKKILSLIETSIVITYDADCKRVSIYRLLLISLKLQILRFGFSDKPIAHIKGYVL